MSGRKLDPATEVVHLGRDPAKHMGAVNTPVYRATTMVFPTLDDLEASAAGRYEGIGYGLHGLPTVTDFQSAISGDNQVSTSDYANLRAAFVGATCRA